MDKSFLKILPTLILSTMAREIYLYTPVYDFSAQSICSQIEEAMGEPVTMRVNSPGGNVLAGWAIAQKMMEHGDVNINVDGACMSMATSLLPFAKKVTASDVAQFMMHAASVFMPTEEEKAVVAKMNKDILAKMKLRIDAKKFKEVVGVSLNELFTGDPEARKDIFFTSQQAKDMGLIDAIVKLAPKDVKAFSEKIYLISAEAPEVKPTPEIKKEESNPTKMEKITLDQLKKDFPEVYAQAIKEGVDAERDRVGAWMAYSKIDPEAVAKGIKEGKPLSQTDTAEFNVKALSSGNLAALASGSAKPAETTAEGTALTEEQKKLATFESEIDGNLGLNKKP